MNEKGWDTRYAVNAWKLEAERLAELVEAQRQVIAILREDNVRLLMQIDQDSDAAQGVR